MNQASDEKVRLDKWLWAARFFRTRTLARQAIDGGKIHIDGERGKPGKAMAVGMQVEIRKGVDKWTVDVTGLSSKRGSAKIAQTLYEETEISKSLREEASAQRKLEHQITPIPQGRPSKKERRDLQKFKRKQRDGR